MKIRLAAMAMMFAYSAAADQHKAEAPGARPTEPVTLMITADNRYCNRVGIATMQTQVAQLDDRRPLSTVVAL